MRSIHLLFHLRAPIGALAIVTAGCALTTESRRYGALVDEYDHARPAAVADSGDALFKGDTHLDRAALVRAVLDRNPDVAASRAAWRAALARFPEETAIDDPMVSYTIAPLTLRDDRINQAIEIDQK